MPPLMRKSKTLSAPALGERLHSNEWAAITESEGLALNAVWFGLFFFFATISSQQLHDAEKRPSAAEPSSHRHYEPGGFRAELRHEAVPHL